jgi:glycosyltransferase involved in cell wall biosynthesis
MERVALNLAVGLRNYGISTSLVLLSLEGPYADSLPEDLPVSVLGHRHMLPAIPRLVAYLRRNRPKVLLTSLDYANVAALWARQAAQVDARVICSLHKPVSEGLRDSRLLRERLLLKPAIRLSYPLADAVVAVSAGVADDLSSTTGFPRERITVIHNPVVTEELVARSREPLDHPWFAVDDPPVLLAVGRLTRQKDYPTLLRAFKHLRGERRARLVILGEGEEREALERSIHELGIAEDVQLLGFVENPYPYMRTAAAFVLSSAYEGLPTVMIEAMACGTAVVSTDCPSGPREILKDGRYGALVPVGDELALAEAIQQTLAKPSLPAVDQRARDFTPEHAVKKYVELFGAQPDECMSREH